MKKVLWVSRHAMTAGQLSDLERVLGPIQVAQVNGSPTNVHVPFEATVPETGETKADVLLLGEQKPLKELVNGFDEVAVVLPIGLLQQLLPFVGSGRLLQAKNRRVLLEAGKVAFVHDGWQAVTEVRIVTSDL